MIKNFKCSKCGGKLIEEGLSGIYFCDNCKAMFFKNKNGNYEKREGIKMCDKPWRDDLGDIADNEKEEDLISVDDLIEEMNKFLNEYDTFYESWLNNEMNQPTFHQRKDKRVRDFSNKIFTRLNEK